MATISQQLRDDTREQHKHAEGRALERALVRGVLPQPLYVEYLGQRLWVHDALEAALASLAEKDPRVAAVFGPPQRQAANLAADLAHFGVERDGVRPVPATLEFLDDLEVLAESAGPALLGVLYVLEGSKNGARYIAAAIRRAYALTGEAGLKYLDPHGERQPAVWAEFKVRLDHCDFTPAERAAIIDAARLCFTQLAEVDDQIGAALEQSSVT